jgi:hypothetical protein
MHIDYVLIENQPVLKNPVMKSIQIVTYSYFKYIQVIEGKWIKDVCMVNACNKVKFATNIIAPLLDSCEIPDSITSSKNNYKKNKDLSIFYTSKLLEKKTMQEEIDFFTSFKKKDDLSDTLLQGLYFFQSKC